MRLPTIPQSTSLLTLLFSAAWACSSSPSDSDGSETSVETPGPATPSATAPGPEPASSPADTPTTEPTQLPAPTPAEPPGPTPGPGPVTPEQPTPTAPTTPGPTAPTSPPTPEPTGPNPPVTPQPTATEEPVGPTPPGEAIACETPEEETFSFFMISYEAIVRESGSPDGFGGDLGGITGADALCQRVAEYSSPCAANNTWRAFLSTTTEDAIDRIGPGPWYDRVGRLFANNLDELPHERPTNADPEIMHDFPNEYGIPNRNPDQTGNVDNHQTLTGSGADGRLYTQSTTDDQAPTGGGAGGGFGGGGPSFGGGSEACPGGWTPEKATCWDWTSKEPEGCPRVGHSWTRGSFGEEGWISFWNEGGCAAGVVLEELGGPNGDPTVGSAGGYGGFYCFAIMGE